MSRKVHHTQYDGLRLEPGLPPEDDSEWMGREGWGAGAAQQLPAPELVVARDHQLCEGQVLPQHRRQMPRPLQPDGHLRNRDGREPGPSPRPMLPLGHFFLEGKPPFKGVATISRRRPRHPSGHFPVNPAFSLVDLD